MAVRSDKGKGKQPATASPPAQSPLIALQSHGAGPGPSGEQDGHPQSEGSDCSDESDVTRAWSGSDLSGETLVDPDGEEPVPPPDVSRPQVAEPQVNQAPMTYGTVYGNLLGPPASPVPSPLASPDLAPVSPTRGTFSEDGDEVDLYLTPDIIIGGRQQDSSSDTSQAEEDQDCFSDYVSLGDLSGSTLRTFDSMPSNFQEKINQSDKFQDKVTDYLQDVRKYNQTHWLAAAGVDFGLAPRPALSRQDKRIARDLNGSYHDLPRGHALREPLQAMPLEPTSPVYFLRMKILAGFVARCAAAKHPVPRHPHPTVAQFQNGTKAPCPLCAKASGFIFLHGHNSQFLKKIMLPLSELISYAEMTALLNVKILQRAFDEVELATRTPDDRAYPWDCVRSEPTLEEFEDVLYEAQMQFMVFDTGKIVVDENGLVAAAPRVVRK